MGIEERYRFLAFAFTAAGHALVLVLFLLGGSHVGQAWPLQLCLLLAASLALSATTFALRGKWYARLCFAPKLLVLALFSDVALGMAGGGALFVEMEGAFIGIAIVEISLYFKIAASLSLDALALAISLCAAVATSAVDPSFPRLVPEVIALVSAAALAASIVANALRAAVARLSPRARGWTKPCPSSSMRTSASSASPPRRGRIRRTGSASGSRATSMTRPSTAWSTSSCWPSRSMIRYGRIRGRSSRCWAR
jgi:hypothetical protein